MKKLFTKISLLCIGLMLCMGNAWAAGTYHDPVENGDGYYEETYGPVTYRIDYTLTINGTTKARAVKNHNGTQTAYIHSHNVQSLLTLISEISLINIETSGATVVENSFPVAIEPGTFANYNGFIFLPEWNSADETKNIYYKGTDNGMPVWGDVFGPNAKVYVSNNTNFVLYSQQHGEHTLNNTTYYYWEGHIASADIINSHNILHDGDFGTNNALHWALYDDGSLSITGSGAMPDFVSASAAPWNEYRNDILFVIIGKDITKIGAYSFGDHPKLYSVSFEDGSVLTEIGANAFYFATVLPSINLPSTLTTIGNCAFSQCDKLQSITLPASVTTLGQSIFALCDNFEILTSLSTTPPTIDKGGSSFFGSTQLHTIIIPEGSMCDYYSVWGTDLRGGDSYDYKYTLDGEALECLTGTCGENLNWSIEGGVLTISGTGTTMTNYTGYNQPWYDNRNDIKAIVFDAPNLEHIGNYAFFDSQNDEFTEVTIPNSVVSIGSYAFRNCKKLTAIHLGSAVRTIGSSAFSYCTALKEPICNGYMFVQMPTSYSGAYTIQAGTVEIKNNAFSGCTGLTAITIPNTVTNIGTSVFMQTGLTSIPEFPSTITSIPASTFMSCASLTEVEISDQFTSIGSSAFSGCSNLASVTISNSVTSIGGSAFSSCSKLTSITIPSSVTSIESYTFQSCTKLASIDIPNSVTSLGTNAFQSCNTLTSVKLPAGLTEIKNNTFNGCTKLSDLYLKGASIETIGTSNTFKNCTTVMTIHVPVGSLEHYTELFENASSKPSNCFFVEDIRTFSDESAATTNTTLGSLLNEDLGYVTLARPVQKGGQYNTLCLPFSLTEEQIAKSSLATAEIFKFSGATKDGDELELYFQPVTELTAGVPYFFRFMDDGANLSMLSFADVTVTTATAGSVTHNGVTLIGTLSQVSVSGSDKLYLAANNELHWSSSAKTINPFRAYFSVAGLPAGAPPRARIVEREAVATDIESAQTSAISSQKVIENGQLYIIRNGVRYNAAGQVVK